MAAHCEQLDGHDLCERNKIVLDRHGEYDLPAEVINRTLNLRIPPFGLDCDDVRAFVEKSAGQRAWPAALYRNIGRINYGAETGQHDGQGRCFADSLGVLDDVLLGFRVEVRWVGEEHEFGPGILRIAQGSNILLESAETRMVDETNPPVCFVGCDSEEVDVLRDRDRDVRNGKR